MRMRRTSLYSTTALAILCISLLASGCSKAGDTAAQKTMTTAALDTGKESTVKSHEANEPVKETEKETKTKGPWFEKGEWTGDVYTNTQAGIRVVLPEGWTAFTDEELKQIMNAGYDQLSEQQKKQYDLNMQYQQTMYDLGAAGQDGQSSLLFLVENLGNSPLTARMGEEAYLDIIKKQLEQMQVSYIIDDITEQEIAGDTWKVLSAQCLGLVQWYAVHKEDQRMETFIITVPDLGEELIDEILSGITGV